MNLWRTEQPTLGPRKSPDVENISKICGKFHRKGDRKWAKSEILEFIHNAEPVVQFDRLSNHHHMFWQRRAADIRHPGIGHHGCRRGCVVRVNGQHIELLASKFYVVSAKMPRIAQIEPLSAFTASVGLDFTNEEQFICFQNEIMIKHACLLRVVYSS